MTLLEALRKVTEEIKNWVENKFINMKPQLTTVILPAANWIGESNPWSQVISINGVTANSRIDLRATALQIIELQDNDIAFIAENNNGIVTVYALGGKPTVDYTIQAEITEVVAV